MNWTNILSEIFEVCVIPLLGIAVSYFVKWMNAKSKELENKTNNEIQQKYIEMLNETITNCVIATNQTYVNALKNAGKFDAQAQKEAFNLSYQAVVSILSEDAQKYLTTVYGDLNAYVIQKIEAEVNKIKVESEINQMAADKLKAETEINQIRATAEIEVNKMKTDAEIEANKVKTEAEAEANKVKIEAKAEANKVKTEAKAEAKKVKTEAEIQANKIIENATNVVDGQS